MIIVAEAIEKAMQPIPNRLRLPLINLNPIAKINKVTSARTADIPTIAIQYNISKNCATICASPYLSVHIYLIISDLIG